MNIALMAHDNKKELMIQFCIAYCGILAKHTVCGTGTTARVVAEATGMPVKPFMARAHGGIQQIGARITYDEIDMVIYLSYPKDEDDEANLSYIRRLCDEHGIVMIADEVQSGFARTGKLFAMDHYADKPDLMTMAKSLAGGMPLSGVVGNANIMDAPAPGGLGGTYAGNPLAVAAAHVVLNIIDKESLCERANQLGQRLKNTLIDAKESVPAIAAVRGLGSMIAAEFNDPQTGEPSAAIAQKIQQRALAQGLLLLTCGAYGNVIRFLYPLTIPDVQFDAAMKILQDALSD